MRRPPRFRASLGKALFPALGLLVLAVFLSLLFAPSPRPVSPAPPPRPSVPPSSFADIPENAAAPAPPTPSSHPAEGPRGLPCVVTLASAPPPADRAAIAAAASLVFQCVGDASGAFSGLPDDLHDLFGQADAAGAAVHSHSWGTPLDSAYDVDSLAADEFAYDHPASLLVFAAGNAGVDRSSDGRIARRTLATPATLADVALLV